MGPIEPRSRRRIESIGKAITIMPNIKSVNYLSRYRIYHAKVCIEEASRAFYMGIEGGSKYRGPIPAQGQRGRIRGRT